jgi:hypothetical protein
LPSAYFTHYPIQCPQSAPFQPGISCPFPSRLGANTLNRNFIHDKKRNRLGAKTADKLAYIHVNMRILERGDQDPRSWYELPTTGLVEFEEDAQEAHNQPSWALAA